MELILRYEKDDWKNFQSFLEKDLLKSTKMWYDRAWFNVALWFVIAFAFFTISENVSEFDWITAGIVSFSFIFIYAQLLLTGLKFKKLCAPSENGSFLGEHRFRFDENAIHSEGKGYKANHNWSVVKRIARTNDAIYIFLDSAYAYIFPLSKIEDPEQLYDYASSKINTTRLST